MEWGTLIMRIYEPLISMGMEHKIIIKKLKKILRCLKINLQNKRAVDGKRFLESNASSILGTYFSLGLVNLRFLESRKHSIRGTFYLQLPLDPLYFFVIRAYVLLNKLWFSEFCKKKIYLIVWYNQLVMKEWK
jgi:hypothetical protein